MSLSKQIVEKFIDDYMYTETPEPPEETKKPILVVGKECKAPFPLAGTMDLKF